jgi:hypothetical protein
MKSQTATSLRLRACRRCGGDAYLDTLDRDLEWRCLQCARVVLDAAEPGAADRQPKAA